MTSPVSTWTEGRFRAFITSALRSAFRKFPNKFAVLKRAFEGKRINKRTGREAAHYKCATCEKLYVAKDVQVDHIEPVVSPSEGFVSWDVYIQRLYCDETNLQVLCTSCHKKKTASERGKQCTTKKSVTPRKRTTGTRSSSSKRSSTKSEVTKSGSTSRRTPKTS